MGYADHLFLMRLWVGTSSVALSCSVASYIIYADVVRL